MSHIRSNVSPKLFPTLFFAGRAVITLLNRLANTHITLKVRQLKDREDRTKKLPIFYVYVSVLNDGENGKRFAATYFQQTMTYKLGRDIKPTDQLAKIMAFVQQALKNPDILTQRGVSVMHEGTCCRCARPLTHPESIDLGFGPECWSIILSSMPGVSEEDFFQPMAELSGQPT